ncbi:MAG TPA: FAD-dependent monooxygenase [Geminicoccaceae bacterium]|nr:FAD-dependent monooxygenase [Geminicoccaceae bacterium]
MGARCAGAPTAMLLAHKGYKMLLVDRSTFPSDIPQGHFIHRHGPRRLRERGLLDRVVATGCPPSTTITLDTGASRLVGKDLVLDGVAAGYGPRRGALDQVLIDGAVAAGVHLREGFAVEEYVSERDRIVGIGGRERTGGALVSERAILTVGADGRGSRLARTVQAPEYDVTPTLTCWYFSYRSGVVGSGLELYVRPERVIFAFPTNDSLCAIFTAWPIDCQRVVQADLERHFVAVIDLLPDLAERVRAGRREERFSGAANLPNFLRSPYGPGWALVGDAGCHKDPYLALGICDAFRDAELLVDAIDQGLAGTRPLEAALREYEQRRNEATMADYRMNLDLARFTPPTVDQQQLQAALHGNQEATNQFFMAREGMIPPESFFQS